MADIRIHAASQVVLVVKNLPAKAGDSGDASSTPGSGRSPGGGNGNLLTYSCLENPVDRAAWQNTVHSVTEENTTEGLTVSKCNINHDSQYYACDYDIYSRNKNKLLWN